VTDDVGGDQDVELAAGEALDDVAAGGRRQGAVEDADLARAVLVQLGSDGVDRLAGEGDDQRLRADAVGPDRCPQDVQAREPLVVDDLDALGSATRGLSTR